MQIPGCRILWNLGGLSAPAASQPCVWDQLCHAAKGPCPSHPSLGSQQGSCLG